MPSVPPAAVARGKSLAEGLADVAEKSIQKARDELARILERAPTPNEDAIIRSAVKVEGLSPDAAVKKAYDASATERDRTLADAIDSKAPNPPSVPPVEMQVGRTLADEMNRPAPTTLAETIDGAPRMSMAKPAGIATVAGAGTVAAALSGDAPKPAPATPTPAPAPTETPPTAVEPTPTTAESSTPAADGGSAPPATSPATSAPPPEEGVKVPAPSLRDANAELAAAGLDAPPVPLETPKEFEKQLTYIDENLAKLRSDEQLDGDRKAAISKLETKKDELGALYESEKERIGWLQLASVIGNALAKIGAGMYGIKHGVDMSGAKFDSGSWEAHYDRSLNEHRLRLAQAREGFEDEERTIGEQRRRLESWRESRMAASRAKASADQQTAASNASARQSWINQKANVVTSVASGNQDASNASSRLQVQLDAQWNEYLRSEATKIEAAKTRVKDEASNRQFTIDHGDYQAARSDFVKSETNFQDGLGMLYSAASQSGAQKEATVRSGLAKIGGHVDPAILARYGLENAADQKLFNLDDALPKLLADIESGKGRAPVPPRWEQFQSGKRTYQKFTGDTPRDFDEADRPATSARVGGSPAPAAATSTTAPAKRSGADARAYVDSTMKLNPGVDRSATIQQLKQLGKIDSAYTE